MTRFRTPQRSLFISILCVLAAIAFAAPAASAAPGVIQDLGGCTTHTLDANDDQSTGAVTLPFTFDFYGVDETELYVNNNGNVTFQESMGEYTPFDFRQTGQQVIAPFFADVDTRGAGSLEVTYGDTTVNGKPAFCVMWKQVGYYGAHDDKLNSFQLLLQQTAAGASEIVFNYDTIQWETGDASGGVGGLGGESAAAGFSNGAGDPAAATIFDGSFINGSLLDSGGSTSLAANSTSGQPAGRYVFSSVAPPSTGSILSGTVYDPSHVEPQANSPVSICRFVGPCVTRFTNSSGVYRATNLAAGNYMVTAYPSTDSNFGNGSAGPTPISGVIDAPFTQDVVLAPAPAVPPPDTTVGSGQTESNGVPVVFWGEPIPLTTQGCSGGSASYEFKLGVTTLSSGAMAEGPPGTYSVNMPAPFPNHGTGSITTSITCPNPGDNESDTFGVYIDPSGVVVDAQNNPVSGATVTLLQSASASGPFVPVPDGSAVMSPANRQNPFMTGSDGVFHWDVVAGFYKVKATKEGCTSTSTGALEIPPEVTGLVLVINCNPPTPEPGASDNTPASPPAPLATIGKVKMTGKKLTVPVTCAAAVKGKCAGTVVMKIAQPGKKSKSFLRKKLGSLAPGKSATLTIKLKKSAQKKLKKLKKSKKAKLWIDIRIRDSAPPGRLLAGWRTQLAIKSIK